MPFRVLGGGLYLLCGMLCFKAMQRLSYGPLPHIMIAASITMYYALAARQRALLAARAYSSQPYACPCTTAHACAPTCERRAMWIYYLPHGVYIRRQVHSRH